jgi:hypothetical protein
MADRLAPFHYAEALQANMLRSEVVFLINHTHNLQWAFQSHIANVLAPMFLATTTREVSAPNSSAVFEQAISHLRARVARPMSSRLTSRRHSAPPCLPSAFTSPVPIPAFPVWLLHPLEPRPFAAVPAPMSPVLSDIALEIALEDGYTSLAIVTGAEDRDRAMSDDPLLLVGGTGALLSSLSALLTVPPPYLDSDGSDDDEHKVEREGRSDPPSPALSDDGFDVYAADGRDY